VSQYDLNSVPF